MSDVLDRHRRAVAGKSWAVFMRDSPFSAPRKVGNVLAPTFREADTKARRMYGSGAWVSTTPNN